MTAWLQICIFSSLYALCSSYRTPPTKYTTTTAHAYPQDTKWAEQVMSRHLINMTDNLIRDLQYKFETASKVQDTYKHTKSYELGYLAAGVQQMFKLMLEIYRTFANLKDFMDKKYYVEDLLDGYHVMQGYYNELRAQKILYYAALAKYQRIYETREEYFIILDANCGAKKNRFKKVPDDVLQNVYYIVQNLQAYKVIVKCKNEKKLRKDLATVVWPSATRRQFSDIAIFEESALEDYKADEENYKVMKWSVKSEDFKPIEDNLDIDLFTEAGL